MKNPAWNMPRMSKQWMQSHLTTGEQHQLITIIKGANSNLDCLDVIQCMVPVSLSALLQINAHKVDQQCKEDYENLCKKISGFCNNSI
jgi:hypothetical protein